MPPASSNVMEDMVRSPVSLTENLPPGKAPSSRVVHEIVAMGKLRRMEQVRVAVELVIKVVLGPIDVAKGGPVVVLGRRKSGKEGN